MMSRGYGRSRVSKLSQPLWSCLHSDQSPLSVLEYLIQFMAAREALHLLQFWFSVASFEKATSTVTSFISQTSSSNNSTQPLLSKQSPQHPYPHTNITSVAGDANVPVSHSDTLNGATIAVLSGETATTEESTGQVPYGLGTIADGIGVMGSLERGGDGEVVTISDDDRPSELPRQLSLNVVTDAMGIYTTYIALNALTPLHLPDAVRQRVEVNICPEDGVVDRNCFKEAQQFVYDVIEKQYYPDFLRSTFLCKYQLELVSSGGLSLLDFLLGTESLVYFMEFMEAENALPLVQFWLTAESFQAHSLASSESSSAETAMEDAVALYDRYFSLQALEPLGMGDEVRVEIELGICSESGARHDTFATAQLMAYNKMNEKYYPNFLESGLYLKFLDDLLRMVKSGPQQSVSDRVAEQQQHTSDQTETKTTVCHHCFTTCDVDDPESLWRRPQLLMRLGHVDGMGQYHSETNPFPLKTNKSKDHGRQFRWFKSRQEEEEWELAVKVSRNIVAKVLKRTSRTYATA